MQSGYVYKLYMKQMKFAFKQVSFQRYLFMFMQILKKS